MKTIEQRLKERNWEQLYSELNTRGFALLTQLVEPDECAQLLNEFHNEQRYRKTVVMERYRFGKGSYKYFNYPLPNIIEELRRQVYEYLVAVANLWMDLLKANVHYPLTHAEFIAQCHAKGQEKATALILGYGAGGYNTLHQDLYGEIYFPMQIVLFLNDVNLDYTGGEFILTETIPRAQSRAHVLKPRKGDVVALATNFRPVKGTKGYYRVTMKHGVATIETGERFTLGIIFHDAGA